MEVMIILIFVDSRIVTGVFALIHKNLWLVLLYSLVNFLVAWKSKTQQIVSMSSTETEYRAMSVITKELIWFSQLFKTLRVPFNPPAYVYCDSTAALHIPREALKNGIQKTLYVRTDNQLGNVLTKPLYPGKH